MNTYRNETWKTVPDERVAEYLQRQHAVKTWIETLLGITIENENLHTSLKSGVILCYLMKKLDERSIPRIQEDTDKIFQLKENIDFFLAACRDIGVSQYKLFRMNDLWEAQNMVAVVECLAELAQLVERDFEAAPPFILDDKFIAPNLSKQESIKLKTLLSKLRSKPVAGKKPKIAKNVVLQKLKLLAGNGIDVESLTPAFVRLQSVLRGHIQRQKYKTMVRNVAYRDHVAQEILSTEKFYVASLKHLVEVWLKPLEKMSKPLLKHEEIITIFNNVDAIYQLNSQLLESIEKIVNSWHTFSCLGSIFLKIMDFLKVYTMFVQGFNKSCAAIERVQTKKDVAAYFEECKKHPSGGQLDLPSFLIMPVQRIPRYSLLLSDLVKHTWPAHPDYDDLKVATGRISEIADHINERKREGEKMQKLLDIARFLGGKHRLELVEPGRMYVREGLFDKGEIVVFLFNDLIVVAKPEKRVIGKPRYTVKESFRIQVITLQDSSKGGGHFEIVKVGVKGKPLLKLEAENEVVKQEWFDAVKALKLDLTERQSTKHKLFKEAPKSPGTTEHRLHKSSVVEEWHEKMNNLTQRKSDIEKQLNELDVKAKTRGKKMSKKEKEENEKQEVDLTQQLELVEAEIAEMGEPPLSGQLRRKTESSGVLATQSVTKSNPPEIPNAGSDIPNADNAPSSRVSFDATNSSSVKKNDKREKKEARKEARKSLKEEKKALKESKKRGSRRGS